MQQFPSFFYGNSSVMYGIVGMGTLLNMLAIVLGGLLGLMMGKRMKPNYQNSLMTLTGVCVLFIGIAGAMIEMLAFVDGKLIVRGTMMLIVCLAVGTVIGEMLNIEGVLEGFGAWLKKKSRSEGDTGFLDAFVVSSLTVCIGAMAVVGAIEDGMQGKIATLEAKAMLDFIIIMIMSASMGKGCLFSAIPVGIFQGSVTLLASYLKPFMTSAALSNIALVGAVMIFCVGLNLVWGKKVNVGNTLPALLLAVAWAFWVERAPLGIS